MPVSTGRARFQQASAERSRVSPVDQAAIAQLVEQLTCNEKVQRSIRCGGTTFKDAPPGAKAIDSSESEAENSRPLPRSRGRISEGFPSGQRDQTVNLTASAFVGSNPTPSTRSERLGRTDQAGIVQWQNLSLPS